jgi:hydrogenase-4 component F
MMDMLAHVQIEPLTAVLLIPAGAAVLLALLPGYWLAARLNSLAALSTLVAAVLLLFERPAAGTYLFVDDLNIVFIVLSTFVASPPACSARATSATSSPSAG